MGVAEYEELLVAGYWLLVVGREVGLAGLQPLDDPIGVVVDGPGAGGFGFGTEAGEVGGEDLDIGAVEGRPEFREGCLRAAPAVEAEESRFHSCWKEYTPGTEIF